MIGDTVHTGMAEAAPVLVVVTFPQTGEVWEVTDRTIAERIEDALHGGIAVPGEDYDEACCDLCGLGTMHSHGPEEYGEIGSDDFQERDEYDYSGCPWL